MNEEIIYHEYNGSETGNFIINYIGQEGVWALYGQENDGSPYVCLNVGKCKDVGLEIVFDLGRLHFVPFRQNSDRRYINQFKEYCGFSYEQGQVQEYLYPYLATQYHAFRFIYIHDKADLKVEAAYAIKNHAQFWRNGRPHK